MAAGQIALNAGVFLHVFLGPFATERITGTIALGGLPFAIFFLVNLLIVVPSGRLMDRIGRPTVLALGHAFAGLGAGVVAGSLFAGPGLAFPAFVLGLFLLAAGWSVAGLTRVAAADLYPAEERARGVGRFLLLGFAGSVVGALVYVAVAARATPPLPTPFLVAGYVAMVPLHAVGSLSMIALLRTFPKPTPVRTEQEPMRAVLQRPRVAWTIASNVGANAGMVGVMSFASPALVLLEGPVIGAIILSHFGGMFLPSALAGRLADRRGRFLAILVGGVVLALGSILFIRTDVPIVAGIGLFLVGAGWCFTFIPGTALLADATTLEERGALFGTNDAIVAIVGGSVVLAAGLAFSLANSIGLAAVGVSLGVVPIVAAANLRRGAARRTVATET